MDAVKLYHIISGLKKKTKGFLSLNAQLSLVSVDNQSATAGTCVQISVYIQHESSQG